MIDKIKVNKNNVKCIVRVIRKEEKDFLVVRNDDKVIKG